MDEIDEEVDEVEVQLERTDDAQARHGGGVQTIRVVGELADFLRVIGGEGHEDGDAGVADERIQAAVAHEDVHQRGDDQANQRHEGDAPNHREIALGHRAEDGHRGEGAGGREERRLNRPDGIDQQQNGERDAVERRIHHEEHRGHGGRDFVDGEREREDQHELGDRADNQRAGSELEGAGGDGIRHHPGNHAGDGQACGHPAIHEIVDTVHTDGTRLAAHRHAIIIKERTHDNSFHE